MLLAACSKYSSSYDHHHQHHTQGRIQKYGLGGLKGGSRYLPSPTLPLLVDPLNPARESGGSPAGSGLWGGVPAEIEFGTF